MRFKNYELIEKLYQSGTTEIIRVKNKDSGQGAVIKILQGDHPSTTRVQRLRQEFDILQIFAEQKSASVIRPIELIFENQSWGLVLEDFGGITLSNTNLSGNLDPLRFLELAIQLTDALDEIHKLHIIHCDINPSNILINTETKELKLIDFDISSLFSRMDTSYQHPNTLKGTLAYISPEQTGRINKRLDFRSDFYSLGATLYEVAAGVRPFICKDPLELIYSQIAREPDSLAGHNPDFSGAIVDIIVKLMAKDPRNRYQSATGLRADLTVCLEMIIEGEIAKSFPLGKRDLVNTLQFSETLYGRDKEIDLLLKSYKKILKGKKSMVILDGLPGVGKSSLVREIYKPVTRDNGVFLSGKFNQLKRNIPYSAFIQAIDEFIQMIMAEDPEILNVWSENLNAALGNIGKVIVDAVPAFEKIIGPQKEVPSLNGPEAKNRFFFAWQIVFKEMARREHPLVLFLDDMQWADQGSLDLLTYLFQRPNLSYFFPICAYRSNEVKPGHPFMESLDLFSKEDCVTKIIVENLSDKNTSQILTDSLGAKNGFDDLAELIYEKTMGNPFFVLRFIFNLYHEGYLDFNNRTASWAYDMDELKRLELTDNVATMLSENLEKLPSAVQNTLKYASCIGNRFSIDLLAIVTKKKIETLKKDIAEGVEEGFLFHRDHSIYYFVHDRVLKAAYGKMSKDEKAATHWKVGRHLLEALFPLEKKERLFEITDHLFLGRSSLKNSKEKEELAELAITAGMQAKASGVFSKAFEYFSKAISLYTIFDWGKDYTIGLTLHTEAAVTAGLSSKYKEMEYYSAIVKENALSVLDQVKVFEALIMAHNSRGDHLKTVDTALEILTLLGVTFPQAPDEQLFMASFQETMDLVALMDEDALFSNTPTLSPEQKAMMGIINLASDAVFHSRPDFLPHLVFKQIQITLKYGICPGASAAFALFGLILCGPVQDIETGVTFGRLAVKIIDQFDTAVFKAKTFLIVNNCIMHWKEQNRNGLDHFLTAYRSGLETGDLPFAAIAAHAYCYNALFTAMPLSELDKKMKFYDESITDIGQFAALTFHRCYYQTVENLLGKTTHPEKLCGPVFDYQDQLPELLEAQNRTAIFVLYFCHIFLGIYLGKTKKLGEDISKAREYQDGVVALIHNSMLNFYESLYLLDCYKMVSESEKEKLKTTVQANQQALKTWADHAPSNHEYKYLLIEAKSQQLWGKVEMAEKMYKNAVSCVYENSYCHEEYLIRENYAGFYFETNRFGAGIKQLHKAYHIAQQWGAEAIVEQLEQRYFQYISMERQSSKNYFEGTMTTTKEFVDTQSIIKAFQTLSEEIHLDALLEKMTEIMIRNAGATRGFFLEFHEKNFFVQAAYTGQKITGILSNQLLGSDSELPQSVLNYVAQSKKPVLLENIALDRRFSQDPVVKKGKNKSVLCVPVIHKGELLALMYLENDLAQGVFTQDNKELISILAGQAAISYENAKLYDTLDRKVKERTKALAIANEELQRLASTDKLTGIANRRIFDEVLDKEWSRLKREKGELSLILCDIDLFKNYNDFYGHQKGDECLAKVAEAIKKALNRPGDIATRYGGEEFGIILPQTDVVGVYEIAEKIRNSVHALKIPNKGSLVNDFVTISIGVATTRPEGHNSSEALLKVADKALYRAKEMGRNQVSNTI